MRHQRIWHASVYGQQSQEVSSPVTFISTLPRAHHTLRLLSLSERLDFCTQSPQTNPLSQAAKARRLLLCNCKAVSQGLQGRGARDCIAPSPRGRPADDRVCCKLWCFAAPSRAAERPSRPPVFAHTVALVPVSGSWGYPQQAGRRRPRELSGVDVAKAALLFMCRVSRLGISGCGARPGRVLVLLCRCCLAPALIRKKLPRLVGHGSRHQALGWPFQRRSSLVNTRHSRPGECNCFT